MSSILEYAMCKGYIKDANGKYKLVDKETQSEDGEGTPEAKSWVKEIKELEARLKRLEAIVIDPRK
jgi:hypothetical protein